MHAQALEWVARFATDEPVRVLDIGGRDINGTPRVHFPNAAYTVLDIRDAAGVDIIADAATWTPDAVWDVVVCTEVFEHADVWREICSTAHKACAAGGLFIATMAGPGRPAHSAIDGGTLRSGEYYANVGPGELRHVLESLGWRDVVVDQLAEDVRASATR